MRSSIYCFVTIYAYLVSIKVYYLKKIRCEVLFIKSALCLPRPRSVRIFELKGNRLMHLRSVQQTENKTLPVYFSTITMLFDNIV